MRTAYGLALGFFGAFVGVFVSRVFLANSFSSEVLDVVLAVNGLTALAVVLAVEGFTSAVPVNVSKPVPLLRGMNAAGLFLSLLVGIPLVTVFALFVPGYGFLKDSFGLVVLAVLVVVFVGLGQVVESAAGVMNKDVVIVWRRSSVQFVGLLLFMLIVLMFNVGDGIAVIVWFVAGVVASVFAFVSSLFWLRRGNGGTVQLPVREASKVVLKDYLFHHASKLGIVLPRFIIPVIVVGLFGLVFNTRFVILLTVLGFLSVVISAVSRGFMSHSGLHDAWRVAWGGWLVLFLLPAVLVFLFSDFVVGLFGVGFNDLGGLLKVGVVGFFFYGFVDMLLARLRVVGSVKLSSVLSLASGVVLVVAVIVSGLLFGLEGVIWSYVFVYSLFALLMFVLYMRRKAS